MPERSQYSFWGALRVFSLAVALISCGLGIRLGWNASDPHYILALLLLLGGVLAQAGMNLINDTEDLYQNKVGSITEQSKKRISRNQRSGWIAFGLATCIGLYLVSHRGWPLFGIFLGSALLALNYNTGPLNFKHNGIAIIQVFLLMGLIMVEASYFTMTGYFSGQVVWLSLPVSLLISLLLLSNEIRDFNSDTDEQIRTLSVRIGLPVARWLYWGLIAAALILTMVYAYLGWVNASRLIWLIPPLLMLPSLKQHLYAMDREKLTPLSGQFFLIFGAAYLYMVSV
jgi:1,4-dihydroxy-2-naphthoate octaprenyltransferase